MSLSKEIILLPKPYSSLCHTSGKQNRASNMKTTFFSPYFIFCHTWMKRKISRKKRIVWNLLLFWSHAKQITPAQTFFFQLVSHVELFFPNIWRTTFSSPEIFFSTELRKSILANIENFDLFPLKNYSKWLTDLL